MNTESNPNRRESARVSPIADNDDGFLDDFTDQVQETSTATVSAAKSFYNEWREFALRKNIFDVAVGLLIGTALSNLSNSVVQDLISPLIFAWWTDGNLVNLFVVLKAGNTINATYDTPGEAAEDGAVTFNYGNFISQVLNFFVVTFSVFIMFKVLTRVKNDVEKLI